MFVVVVCGVKVEWDAVAMVTCVERGTVVINSTKILILFLCLCLFLL